MYWNPRIECIPRDELKKLQYRSLKSLVYNLYSFNAFYRDRMKEAKVHPDDVNSLDDIVKLPFMYKQDLRDNYPTKMFTSSPEDVVPITGAVPDPDTETTEARRAAKRRMLDYMGLTPGTRMQDVAIDVVFIGSCTNGRIEDLRAAAAVAKGRKVAGSVRAMVVPGSGLVKQQAEAEGLDRIFAEAGFEWREPGCSMCLGMNPDQLKPGQRSASTSNRNFEGRQGPGGRTHLMSPAMAAAAAVTGKLADVRQLVN